MSEAVSPIDATPPDPQWTWYSGLRGSQLTRQPERPTLFVPFKAHPYPDLATLAYELARRLQGASPRVTHAVVATDDFDTFPAFAITGEGGAWIGYAAVQRTRKEQLAAAIVAAQAMGRAA